MLTIENITPHANGNFDFVSSDDALVVGNTAHGLSLSIDEDELDFVKEIKSGNELTLTVDDDGNGTVTLTAAGGGGGAGNIAFAGGKCIDVVPDNNATTNVTTYTINNDLDCLNSSLGFATDQDITDAIGNITIPEKTSDLVNDGDDGLNPFITAADIPDIPDGTLPISDDRDPVTVTLDSPSANTFTVSTGGKTQLTVRPDGNIGQGYAGQGNINYAIYQGFGTSTQEQIGFLSAPKFDGQPAVRCVGVESQPLFTDVVAGNIYHFSVSDARAGNKSFTGQQIGFYSQDFCLLYTSPSQRD